jgi:hypothetical protein
MSNQPQRPTDHPEIVATIAQQLGETQPHPMFQIRRIVQRLGPETALAFLRETLEIEAAGGMPVPDGSRRRTPGGVFFHLVRSRVSPEDRAYIFPYPHQKQKAKKKTQAKPPPPRGELVEPLTWDNRLTFIRKILEEKGAASTVKLTLIGRPGRLVKTSECMVTIMQSGKIPPLPKGLPKPPDTPTTYVLYIAHKQWLKVEEAIKNPEDALIVEGFPVYDPELKGVAVFATNVTTKILQRAKRQESA